MKRFHWLLMACAAVVGISSFVCLADKHEGGKKKILMYSQSFGFRHSVVRRPLTGELSHAEKIFKEIATKAGYEVYVSQDHNDLNGDQYKNYDAVVFYTSGNPPINREHLMKYVENGGALIGIHSATDTYKDWPEYVKLMGGAFAGHGGNQMPIEVKIEDPDHPAAKVLGGSWSIADEIYQFKPDSPPRKNTHMVLSVDTDKMSAEALKHHNMKKGGDYALAWTNTKGKGRVFYTSLGHREDVWTNPTYQKHLLAGIKWALNEDGKDKPERKGS